MNDSVVHTDSHPLPIHFVFVGLWVVVITFLVFSPTLRSNFLAYDDDIYVYNNPRVQTFSPEHFGWFFAHPYYRSYIPLTMVSHTIDYALWQNDPRGHHLTSLLLHSINALWVFFLGLVVYGIRSKNPGRVTWPMVLGSAAAALLFALHPLRVESVAWVSDRKDLLCAFFLFPSFIAYLWYATRRGGETARRWYIVSLVLFTFALLSKPIAVMAPAVLLLVDFLLLERGNWRDHLSVSVREKLPFFALSLAAGVMAMVAAPGSQEAWMIEHLSPGLKLVFPFYATMFYLLKTIVPLSLTPVYPRVTVEILFVAFGASLVIVAACVYAARRGKRDWLLALLVYVLFLLPTLLAASSGIQPIADRYSYMASISLFVLCGAGIVAARPAGLRFVLIGVAGILVVWGALSVQQVSHWRDAESLWRYVVSVQPEIPLAHNNLGTALQAKGDPDGAIAIYHAALALKPDYPEPWYNMGIAYEAKGDARKAEEMYLRAIITKRDYLDAYVNLGNLYVQTSRVDTALAIYARAARIDPVDADVYYNMGFAYYMRGDHEQALTLFLKTIQLDPAYSNAYFNAGVILGQEGKMEEAFDALRKAARLGHREARKFLEQKGERW